ncbi:MAG: hypothetical protein QOD04_5746 [Pseudonocardiales bacterium]|jgi:hypothetical protein|nr:hypothetical protein [Pseudonocardiales bacterium]
MLDPVSFDDLQAERYDQDEYRNDAYGPHGPVYPRWADLILSSGIRSGHPACARSFGRLHWYRPSRPTAR